MSYLEGIVPPQIPAKIPGLEAVISHIGPQVVAEVIGSNPDTDVAGLAHDISQIEGWTMVGGESPARCGTSYELIEQLGGDVLRIAMGVPKHTTTDQLRLGIQELHRRDTVRRLGLPPNATKEEITAEIDRLHRLEKIERLGLPANASTEELRAALDKERQEDIEREAARQDAYTPIPTPSGKRRDGETWEQWAQRHIF